MYSPKLHLGYGEHRNSGLGLPGNLCFHPPCFHIGHVCSATQLLQLVSRLTFSTPSAAGFISSTATAAAMQQLHHQKCCGDTENVVTLLPSITPTSHCLLKQPTSGVTLDTLHQNLNHHNSTACSRKFCHLELNQNWQWVRQREAYVVRRELHETGDALHKSLLEQCANKTCHQEQMQFTLQCTNFLVTSH